MFFVFNTLFSYSTWSQFIDEMKTLEYKNLVVIGNPLADTPTNDVSQGETINIKPSIWPSDFVEVPYHELLFQVSDHYPCAFLPSAVTENRKQFQYLNMALNNLKKLDHCFGIQLMRKKF